MALLRNSKHEGNTVVKCIALNPATMQPRMVLKAIRGNNDRCTQQEVNKDDIVLMCTNSDEGSLFEFLYVTKVSRYKTFMSKITVPVTSMSSDVDWLGLFRITDDPLLDWLTDVNQSPLLPAGYGWDGQRTRYEQAKFSEFCKLLAEVDFDLKEKVIDWAMVSPRENVNHQWNTAQAIPRDPIYLPAAKNVLFHFVILWRGEQVSFIKYDDKDYKEHSLLVNELQDDKVTKAIVATVLTNKYGENLRWKLYR